MDSTEEQETAQPDETVQLGEDSKQNIHAAPVEHATVGDEAAAPAVPTISSYFDQAPAEDPFRAVTPDPSTEIETGGTAADLKLELPGKDEQVKLQQEDTERLYSPPVTKDEMTNEELATIPETTVDLSKSTPAELNRMYDAWIASETTRRFLVQSLTATGSFHLPPEKVLSPRLAMADTQPDPIYSETYKLRGEKETMKRDHVLNLSHVEHTMTGLHQLIKAESWRSALDLTAILLTNMGQGLQPVVTLAESVITEASMKVWSARVALLAKLRMFSIAEAECQQFSHMDSPELHFEFHQKLYPGRTGSMVPFSLRLLYACLPQFLGRHNESLDRLFHVRGQINKMLHNLQNGACEDGGATVISEVSRNASLALWHQRELQVMYSLGSCLTDMKDFRLAITIYKEILARDPNNVCFTYSTMARICLQMGAMRAAESYFSQSVEACQNEDMKVKLAALHSGYLSVCDGDYKSAPENFSQGFFANGTNSYAKNNAAVSMLYNGQSKAGVLLLEELIHSDPAVYLQDTIATNLCTLYELESSVAKAKKQTLLLLANQCKGNGFNINCLKIDK